MGGGICEKIPGTGIFFQKKKIPIPGTLIKKKKIPVPGGGVAPVLKLDRCQGSVTNAKTPIRGGEGEFAVGHRKIKRQLSRPKKCTLYRTFEPPPEKG
jgi:hypothetical protein